MSSEPSGGSPSMRSSISAVAEAPAELSVERVKEIRKDYVTRHKEVSSILFGIDSAPTSMPEPLVFSTPLVRHKSKINSHGATMTPTSGRRNGSLILTPERADMVIASTPDNSSLVNGLDSASPRSSFLTNFWGAVVDTVTSPMAIFHSTDPESMDDDESVKGLKGYKEPLEEELEDDLSTLATVEIYNKCGTSIELDELDRRDALLADHTRCDSLDLNSCEEKDDGTLNMSCLSDEGFSPTKSENGRHHGLFLEAGEESRSKNQRKIFSKNSCRSNSSESSTFYSRRMSSSEMDDSLASPRMMKARELLGQIDIEKKKKRKKPRDKDKEKVTDDTSQSHDGSSLLVELRAWRDIELEADASFIRGLRQTRRDLEDRLELIRLKEQFEASPDV